MLHPLFLLLILTTQRPPHLPDPVLTPGSILPTVTAADVCTPGYAGKARHVTEATKRAVFRRYGVDWKNRGNYEVDHLLSLELGGANVVENLWIEPWTCNVGGRELGAHTKDLAENAVHRAVCAGRISLKDAQRRMAADWPGLFREFVSAEFPKAKP